MKKLFLAMLFIVLFSTPSYASNFYWVNGKYVELQTPAEYYWSTYDFLKHKGFSRENADRIATRETNRYITTKLPHPIEIFNGEYNMCISYGYTEQQSQKKASMIAETYAYVYGFK